MDAMEYLPRAKGLSSYTEFQALMKELRAKDNETRALFARARESWEVEGIEDPYLSLVWHNDDTDSFKVLEPFPEDAAVPKVFPLTDDTRRAPGSDAVVSVSDFKRNFDVFTESQLKYLNWDNVFAAGGSILACMLPPPGEHNVNNSARRKYYHDVAYPGSDVDLFIYGLNEADALAKLEEIYASVVDANPYPVVAFRSAFAITLVSQYPFRHIQIVTRLYNSPAEILAGFDVDSCAVGFDGSKAWLAPRAHLAVVTQQNPVDMTRRSPSYEMRLAKYAKRGFEVPVPDLQRPRVDPMVFERGWKNVQGLAKLLLLEKLDTPIKRFQYKEQHHQKKGRRRRANKSVRLLNDAWMSERAEASFGADASSYSTIFLPWGPSWTAAKVRKLMDTKDFVMNQEWHRKDAALYHMHPCFFGTMAEVVKDCCGKCPPLPDHISPEDMEPFVRGPLKWIVDDPGRQHVGSFRPITTGDWMEGAYLSEDALELVVLANANDVAGIRAKVAEGTDPNSRDMLGRTALHVAVLSGTQEATEALVELGTRVSARLTDGRNALHLAAIHNRTHAAKALLAKSAENAAAAPPAAGDGDVDLDGSEEEDEDDGGGAAETKAGEEEEAKQEPDVIDINAPDWDKHLSPLHYAAALGHVDMVKLLLEAGAKADALVTDTDLCMTILELVAPLSSVAPDECAAIVAALVAGGASSRQLNLSLNNVVHTSAAGKHAATFLPILTRHDPAALEVVNELNTQGLSPLCIAISASKVDAVRHLLNVGAKPVVDSADCDNHRRRAAAQGPTGNTFGMGGFGRGRSGLTPASVQQPLALVKRSLNNPTEAMVDIAEIFLNGTGTSAVLASGMPAPMPAGDPRPACRYGNDCYRKNPVHFVSESHPTSHSRYVPPPAAAAGAGAPGSAPRTFTGIDASVFDFNADLGQQTLLDQLIINLSNVKEQLAPKAPKPEKNKDVEAAKRKLRAAAPGTYTHFLLSTLVAAPDARAVPPTGDAKAALETRIEFMERAKAILVGAGAKTAKQLRRQYRDNSASGFGRGFHQRLFTGNPTAQYQVLSPIDPAQPMYGTQYAGTLLPDTAQRTYHEFFEAVWDGDVDAVKHMIVEQDKRDRLLVCSKNVIEQTPVALAALRGNAPMVALLLEVASQQYTPHATQDLLASGMSAGPAKRRRPVANADIAAIAGLGVDGGDGGGLAAVARDTTTNPNTGPKKQGDGEFVCHTDPGSLLRVLCAIPAEALKLPAEWAVSSTAAGGGRFGYYGSRTPQFCVHLNVAAIAAINDDGAVLEALAAATESLHVAAAAAAADGSAPTVAPPTMVELVTAGSSHQSLNTTLWATALGRVDVLRTVVKVCGAGLDFAWAKEFLAARAGEDVAAGGAGAAAGQSYGGLSAGGVKRANWMPQGGAVLTLLRDSLFNFAAFYGAGDAMLKYLVEGLPRDLEAFAASTATSSSEQRAALCSLGGSGAAAAAAAASLFATPDALNHNGTAFQAAVDGDNLHLVPTIISLFPGPKVVELLGPQVVNPTLTLPSVLINALQRNKMEAVEALLAAGADPLALNPTAAGSNTLMTILANGTVDTIVKFADMLSAPQRATLASFKSAAGHTPLMAAAGRPEAAIFAALVDKFPPPSVAGRDVEGNTALHKAAGAGFVSVSAFLTSKEVAPPAPGAVTSENHAGLTPLDVCTESLLSGLVTTTQSGPGFGQPFRAFGHGVATAAAADVEEANPEAVMLALRTASGGRTRQLVSFDDVKASVGRDLSAVADANTRRTHTKVVNSLAFNRVAKTTLHPAKRA